MNDLGKLAEQMTAAFATPRKPIQTVEIVRPKRTGQESVNKFFITLGSLALGAWLIMLISGTLAPQLGLSYWHSVLVVYGARILFANPSWMTWSRERREGEV